MRRILIGTVLFGSVALVAAGCGPTGVPSVPAPKVESSIGSAPTRDGRLGTPCQEDHVIGDDHETVVYRPVCTIPYVRLVADADHYHGRLVGLRGYVLHRAGLRLVPSPEYVRRGMEGEEMDLRGGAADDKLLTELRDRPEWDLCGPVMVIGRFDRTWMGMENHGRVLGEFWLMFAIRPAVYFWDYERDGLDGELYRCISLLKPANAPSAGRVAPAPARGG